MDELTRLLLDARDGDRAALAAFIRRSQGDVWRLCAHLVHREEADDLTQDVYVRAWRALPDFRADASARTWLLAIARRACADAIRRLERRRRPIRVAPVPVVEPDPGARLELHDLVGRLDPDRRDAFVLTQLLGLSYVEAAEVCECRVGTIRSRVARAREDLTRGLSEAAES